MIIEKELKRMLLKNILEGIDYELINGNEDITINKIEYDSRKVQAGDIFVCIKGFNVDGHKYAEGAIKKGAIAIICEDDINLDNGCTLIKVDDTRKALASISANYYNNPAKKLKLIGVTGTNGKTTSTYMIKSILEKAGFKVGIIGTIANYICDRKIETHRTTPESLELQELFSQMVKEKVDYCVMEVSSHSLSLNRVYGIQFNCSIFTNLTQDHLDFHKTFENYYEAKLQLFHISDAAIINMDDKYGLRFFNDSKCTKKITYGIDGEYGISAKNVELHSTGVTFELNHNNSKDLVNINIPGRYNVYNALGVIGACISEGLAIQDIISGLEHVQVPGRCEIVTKGYDLGFNIIVDYAHTPDGLENILETAREFTTGKLISVFGCGGNRDKTKRPIMGKIGCDLSDFAIITSDNPRNEEPGDIIKDILEGFDKDNYKVVENRKEAIKEAIKIAKKDDVIVIAGKGHEDYQILKDDVVIHFDEREIVKDIIKELFNKEV
jgi:UDP-N-acetylmuramoyl-L-alanyl-D-glutamate--2,6-diaminopimelate ligase